ncbi:MAG TPA: EamA family transporter [Burkholderiaceae bacterium]|nr:EamA family transporter [Burkholderiaceae bacterium]
MRPDSAPDSATPKAIGSAAAAIAVVPAVFVLLWSTGFIVARYATPHAPPLTFLAARFAITFALLLALIAWQRPPWPTSRREWLGTIAVGILLQAAYLGGVWFAISAGMPAGVSALIVGTQPLWTLALGRVIGEHADRRQWLGILIGFGGMCLVLADRVTLSGVGIAALAANLVGLAGITAGTLLQKQIGGGVDLRTGSAIQFGASVAVVLPAAAMLETLRIDPAPEFWLAMGWSVIGLSLVAISLLLGMIRRGRATAVASLMYLTPAVTAALAWWLFDQRLGATACAGMAVTMVGVALARSRPRPPRQLVQP